MSSGARVRMVANQPPELVVYDEPGPCSYLPDRTWRLPLRLPVRPLTRAEFDARLVAGDRRQGRLLYRTSCPACSACEPIRLDVDAFEPTRTQRRIFARGEREIETTFGPVEIDEERVTLYNRHKRGRGLCAGESDASLEAYRAFLGESCCETAEMRYRVGGKRLGVAIIDRAATALSAVYFYYDPDLARLSPGVYSILKQVELCRRLGLQHLYLGLYIGECHAMAYKSRFLPHERLIDGTWRRFDRA